MKITTTTDVRLDSYEVGLDVEINGRGTSIVTEIDIEAKYVEVEVDLELREVLDELSYGDEGDLKEWVRDNIDPIDIWPLEALADSIVKHLRATHDLSAIYNLIGLLVVAASEVAAA